MSSRYLASEEHIGKTVILPDGGEATIRSVCISGQFYRVEWLLTWWYQGRRNTLWVEPNEVKLKG